MVIDNGFSINLKAICARVAPLIIDALGSASSAYGNVHTKPTLAAPDVLLPICYILLQVDMWEQQPQRLVKLVMRVPGGDQPSEHNDYRFRRADEVSPKACSSVGRTRSSSRVLPVLYPLQEDHLSVFQRHRRFSSDPWKLSGRVAKENGVGPRKLETDSRRIADNNPGARLRDHHEAIRYHY